MSAQHGWRATFMTKPTSDKDSSSAIHFCMSLWAGDTNTFHDPATKGLSAVGRHWAAGLIKHAPALIALLCPTVNCYRHLHTHMTPDVADCLWESRDAMLRVVIMGPHTTYIENRLPTSAANPYVVMAATVAAGIDGFVNRLQLSSEAAERLPSSLAEALTALEADKVLSDALGEEFNRWFLQLKREAEIAKVNNAKEEERDEMEVERELYFRLL